MFSEPGKTKDAYVVISTPKKEQLEVLVRKIRECYALITFGVPADMTARSFFPSFPPFA